MSADKIQSSSSAVPSTSALSDTPSGDSSGDSKNSAQLDSFASSLPSLKTIGLGAVAVTAGIVAVRENRRASGLREEVSELRGRLDRAMSATSDAKGELEKTRQQYGSLEIALNRALKQIKDLTTTGKKAPSYLAIPLDHYLGEGAENVARLCLVIEHPEALNESVPGVTPKFSLEVRYEINIERSQLGLLGMRMGMMPVLPALEKLNDPNLLRITRFNPGSHEYFVPYIGSPSAEKLNVWAAALLKKKAGPLHLHSSPNLGQVISIMERDYQSVERPVARCLVIIQNIAHGLKSLHEPMHQLPNSEPSAGGVSLVHRDIKPANIIIAPNGKAIVADFGAITYLPNITNEVHIRGVALAAPEEFGSVGSRSPASDMFQLGNIILNLMGFNSMPYSLDYSEIPKASDALKNHQEYLSSIVSSLREQQCPEEIITLIERCLEKDPAKRITAEELCQQFPALAKTWLARFFSEHKVDSIGAIFSREGMSLDSINYDALCSFLDANTNHLKTPQWEAIPDLLVLAGLIPKKEIPAFLKKYESTSFDPALWEDDSKKSRRNSNHSDDDDDRAGGAAISDSGVSWASDSDPEEVVGRVFARDGSFQSSLTSPAVLGASVLSATVPPWQKVVDLFPWRFPLMPQLSPVGVPAIVLPAVEPPLGMGGLGSPYFARGGAVTADLMAPAVGGGISWGGVKGAVGALWGEAGEIVLPSPWRPIARGLMGELAQRGFGLVPVGLVHEGAKVFGLSEEAEGRAHLGVAGMMMSAAIAVGEKPVPLLAKAGVGLGVSIPFTIGTGLLLHLAGVEDSDTQFYGSYVGGEAGSLAVKTAMGKSRYEALEQGVARRMGSVAEQGGQKATAFAQRGSRAVSAIRRGIAQAGEVVARVPKTAIGEVLGAANTAGIVVAVGDLALRDTAKRLDQLDQMYSAMGMAELAKVLEACRTKSAPRSQLLAGLSDAKRIHATHLQAMASRAEWNLTGNIADAAHELWNAVAGINQPQRESTLQYHVGELVATQGLRGTSQLQELVNLYGSEYIQQLLSLLPPPFVSYSFMITAEMRQLKPTRPVLRNTVDPKESAAIACILAQHIVAQVINSPQYANNDPHRTSV